MSGRRSIRRRSSRNGLLGPVHPERWLRRRRWFLAALVVAAVCAAGYDHVRRWGRPVAADPSQVFLDDIARYDGKSFRVIQAVDGDTLHIDVPEKGKPYTIIRLWGVDTPEVHGVARPAYFGPEASKFTHRLVAGRQVRLELVPGRTRDRYGRLLAYVHLPDGGMLNERLVSEGYAYADTRFSHRLRAKFVRLEEQARAAKAGLWAGVTIADMPAWRQKRELQPQVSTGAGDSGILWARCMARNT
jgi:endonuclease YncB( thermonuclease family)